MKIVVIGGSGLIGKKVVKNLRQRGHDVLAASPSSGVNAVTGEGLAQALAGAQVVVEVSNAPNWEDNAVQAFFETSGRNLLAAEAAAGVGHHVALSVVGTDRPWVRHTGDTRTEGPEPVILGSGQTGKHLARARRRSAGRARIRQLLFEATERFSGLAPSAGPASKPRVPDRQCNEVCLCEMRS